MRFEALSTQEIDGVEGHDAVGPATVRHHVASFPQLGEAFGQIRERQRDRSGNMPGGVLLARAHVDYSDIAAADASDEFLVVHRFEGTTRFEKPPSNLFNLSKACLSQVP